MATGTFAGRFRHRDAGHHASCTCTADRKQQGADQKWEDRRLHAFMRFATDMKAIEDEERRTASGEPADETEEKKRREEEEAAERERQEREAVEATKRDENVSHEPPTHSHQPGEAYGITQNLGDAMRRFMAGVRAKYGRSQAPTADELARMTPTERFAAQSKYRHGRR